MMTAVLPEAKWRRVACRIAAFLFGGVFIFSGIVKARDPQLFLMQIRGFHLLGDPFAAWVALGLPWLEIFCGTAVVMGLMRRGGLLLLGLALVVFITVLSIAWGRGLDIECGCFGSAVKTSLRVELLIDLLLLALCVWLWCCACRQSRFAQKEIL